MSALEDFCTKFVWLRWTRTRRNGPDCGRPVELLAGDEETSQASALPAGGCVRPVSSQLRQPAGRSAQVSSSPPHLHHGGRPGLCRHRLPRLGHPHACTGPAGGAGGQARKLLRAAHLLAVSQSTHDRTVGHLHVGTTPGYNYKRKKVFICSVCSRKPN